MREYPGPQELAKLHDLLSQVKDELHRLDGSSAEPYAEQFKSELLNQANTYAHLIMGKAHAHRQNHAA